MDFSSTYQHNNGNKAPTNPLMTYGGTAKQSCGGLPIGLVDIGACDECYIFRVAMPGILKKECCVKCEIMLDGTVYIRGEVNPYVEGVVGGSARLIVQQLPLPGPFLIAFKLPGPVDPRLFAPDFRGDGILEGVVKKFIPKPESG